MKQNVIILWFPIFNLIVLYIIIFVNICYYWNQCQKHVLNNIGQGQKKTGQVLEGSKHLTQLKDAEDKSDSMNMDISVLSYI